MMVSHESGCLNKPVLFLLPCFKDIQRGQVREQICTVLEKQLGSQVAL